MYPSAPMAELRAVRQQLGALMASLDPQQMTATEAAAAIRELAAAENLIVTGKMLLGRRVAGTRIWRRNGSRNPAQWLAKETGSSVGEAVGLLRTADRLDALPTTAEALRAGKLSRAQAVDVVDAATLNPAAEAELLVAATRESHRELRTRCQQIKAAVVVDEQARHAEIHRARYLRMWCDRDGAGRLDLRTTTDALAEIKSALAPFTNQIFHHARETGRREPSEAYAADALVALARTTLESTTTVAGEPRRATPRTGIVPSDANARAAVDRVSTTTTDAKATDLTTETSDGAVTTPIRPGSRIDSVAPTGSHQPCSTPSSSPARAPTTVGPDGAGPPETAAAKKSRRWRNAKIIVRIDHEALVRGHTRPGELCEINGLGPIPVATVDHMIEHDAFVAAIVTMGVDVHTVAHLGRQVSAHQRTALEFRDPTCQVLGCNAAEHLEIDHRTDWAATHETRLTGLDVLCAHHHDLKTNHGYRLAPGTGKRPLLPPAVNGAVHDPDPP